MMEKKMILFSVLLLLLGWTMTLQGASESENVDEDEVESPVNTSVAPADTAVINLTILSNMSNRTLFNATEDCKKAPETGSCKAYIKMFFYNSSSMTCETFVYGGCMGNLNKFKDQKECMKSCHTEDEED